MANPSQFNPSQLGAPLGPPTPVYDMQAGDMEPRLLRTETIRNSPWGPIVEIVQADGSKAYMTAREGGRSNQVAFHGTPDGGFTEHAVEESGNAWDGYKNNSQFWKPVLAAGAIAGGAALYGAAGAGGGGTTAAATGAAAPAAAGAAPGVTGTGAAAATGTAATAANNLRGLEGGSDAVYNGTSAGSDAYNLRQLEAVNNIPYGSDALPAETWQDIATRYGGNIMDWAKANPGLLSALAGGALGYLGNKDPATSTSTTTTETSLDNTAMKYRDEALPHIQRYGMSTAPRYGQAGSGSSAPGGVNWGGTNAPQASGAATKSAGIQGGTLADFQPGGRFTQEGMTAALTKQAPSSTQGSSDMGIFNTPGFNATKPFDPFTGPNTSNTQGRSNVVAPGQITNTPGFNATKAFNPYSGPNTSFAPPGSAAAGGGSAASYQPKQSGLVDPRNVYLDNDMGMRRGMAETGRVPLAGGTPDWGGSNQYMPQVNQYLQQGTAPLTAGANPLAGENNPYLTQMIADAGRDMRQQYDQFSAPKFSSGSSFGNTGLGFAEVAERDRMMDNFSGLANNLRFQDHNMRSGLMESGAARQDALNSGGRNNALTAGGTWGQLGSNAGQFNATFDFTAFQQQQDEQNRRIQALLNGGNMPGPTSTRTTNSTTSTGNPWAGAAAGAVAGANLWKMNQPNDGKKAWGG